VIVRKGLKITFMNYLQMHPFYHGIHVNEYKGGSLKLIQPVMGHAPKSLDWMSDPEVSRYMGGDISVVSLKTERNRIRKILKNKDEYSWMIALGGEVIGNIAINSIKKKSGQFGCRAGDLVFLVGDRIHWRKGIASAAIGAVLQWAFREAGFKVIAARALNVNVASNKTLKRLGFQDIGTEPYENAGKSRPWFWRCYKIGEKLTSMQSGDKMNHLSLKQCLEPPK
jgi:RimJ/RimL family protein N-acetyltransferase